MIRGSTQAATDEEFVDHLRGAVQQYLNAIDRWETAYQKYYRLPAPGSVSADLEIEHREYRAARDQLQRCLPHARRLCLKHSLRDPWPGMLHIDLGSRAPQTGAASAIGRAERGIIAKCLDDLESACRVSLAADSEVHARAPVERAGLFRRIVDYFL